MNFEINGIKYKIDIKKNGIITVLQACEKVGINIPRFCFHEKLSIAGNCRMCLVEIVDNLSNMKHRKPLASCGILLTEGMSIFTNTTLVRKAREGVLEFLLANHPLDCPICDQGGECDLQDQSRFFGSDIGRFYEDRRAVSDKEIGPFVKTIMTRCIHCTRCVRFGTEIAGVSTLGVTGRGNTMEIGNYLSKLYKSEFSGNIVDLCPVGALTAKPYSFVSRPWELRSYEVLDVFDTFGSKIRVDIRGSEIMRILPSLDTMANEEWITDKVRFCYDGLKIQRFDCPLLKNVQTLRFFEVSWDFGFFIMSDFLNQLNIKSLYNENFKIESKFFNEITLLALVGHIISLETLLVLAKFFSFFNSAVVLIEKNFYLSCIDFLFLNVLDYDIFILTDNFLIDSFIFVGFNPRIELPLLNLKIKKIIKNNEIFVGVFHSYINLTYNVNSLGSTLYDFNFMMKGKHDICKLLVNFKNTFFFFGGNFLMKFRIYSDNLFIFLTLSFQKYLRKMNSLFTNFKIIFNKITHLNYLYAGTFSFLQSNIENKKFTFPMLKLFFSSDDFLAIKNKFVTKKDFHVFLGTNGNSDGEFVDLVLPTTNFLEGKNRYVSLEGKVNFSQAILNSELKVRNEWKVLFDFFYFFLFFIKEKTLFNECFNEEKFFFRKVFLLKKLKKTKIFKLKDFILNQKFGVIIALNDSIFLKKEEVLKFENEFFFNILSDKLEVVRESMYVNDVISRSSSILSLAYVEFELCENNFE